MGVVIALLSILLVAGPVAFGLLIYALWTMERRQRSQRAAAWNGLARRYQGSGTSGNMTAVVKGHGVRVIERTERRGDAQRVFTDVDVNGPSKHLSIRRQEMLSSWFTRVDHEVGDPSVDDHWVLSGHPIAIGLLDPRARHLLRNTGLELTVHGGVLRLRRSGIVYDEKTLVSLVEWAVELARCLTAEDDALADRLVRGVASDPDPRVRVRFLEVLAEHAPSHAQRAAQQVGAADPPTLRLRAAALLGDRERLVAVVGDEGATEEDRVEALRLLGGTDALTVRRAVERAVASDRARLWRAAALVARSVQGEEAAMAGLLAGLADRLDPAAWPRHREARARCVAAAREVAVTLGQLRAGPAGQELLCALLRAGDGATQSAAVASLASVGTVEVVPELLAVADGASFLSGLRSEARDAVRAIQARAGGSRGTLALADHHVGDLALPADMRAERRQAARASRRAQGEKGRAPGD